MHIKPTEGTKIPKNNPLVDGCLFYYTINEKYSGSLHDAFSTGPELFSVSANGEFQNDSIVGQGINISGDTGKIYKATNSMDYQWFYSRILKCLSLNNKGFTMNVVVKANSNISTLCWPCSIWGTDNPSEKRGIAIEWQEDNTIYVFGDDGSVHSGVQSTEPLNIDQQYTITWVSKINSNRSGNQALNYLYIDGEQVDTVVNGSNGFVISDVINLYLCIGGGRHRGGYRSPFEGVVYNCGFWDRALSPLEVGILATDPYSIFRRQTPIMISKSISNKMMYYNRRRI